MFFPSIFFQQISLSDLSFPTARGMFFLTLDAQVRGTGDAVNSLFFKPESGRRLNRGAFFFKRVVVWAGCQAGHDVIGVFFGDGGTSPAFTAALRNPNQMNEFVLWFVHRFETCLVGESLCGDAPFFSAPRPTLRSCTRRPTSGFARCTACR